MLSKSPVHSICLLSVLMFAQSANAGTSGATLRVAADQCYDLVENDCDADSCDSDVALDGNGGTRLNGRPGRLRKELADSGIQSANNVTNFYFGNTQGGLEREFRFGGHGDYRLNFDLHKMGGMQGQFVQFRAEHRYGESLADATGAFLPPNLAADLPTNDSRNVYITNLFFTQALSESFALYAGKLDTLDGDKNAFAHGRGISQFSNAAFVVNPIGLRTVAYSTLGAGFVVLDEGEPIFNFLVLNARDTVETDGFSELFADGVVLAPELRIPTNFLGLPGHQLFSSIWSSRNYASLSQSPIIILPSVPIDRQSDSWAFSYNFDQYLFVDPTDETQGWGLFGRAGYADPKTNPIAYFLSLGIGGSSRIKGREKDTFGVGWYYAGTSDTIAPFLSTVLGGISDGNGTEVFYNIAVTKRVFVTAGTQFISPARSNIRDALVCGLRVNVSF